MRHTMRLYVIFCESYFMIVRGTVEMHVANTATGESTGGKNARRCFTGNMDGDGNIEWKEPISESDPAYKGGSAAFNTDQERPMLDVILELGYMAYTYTNEVHAVALIAGLPKTEEDGSKWVRQGSCGDAETTTTNQPSSAAEVIQFIKDRCRAGQRPYSEVD